MRTEQCRQSEGPGRIGLLALAACSVICYHQFMSDDGNQPATKADLQAVREDLKAVETSLDKKFNRGAMEVVKTQADVREIKETMATKLATKDDFNRIMQAIDEFAGDAKHYRQADISRGHTLIEVEVKMKDHEKRITTLESARR